MPRIARTEQLRIARFVAAAFCAIAAGNHVRLALAGDPSVPRHWLFVGVNVVLGTLLVSAPRAALVFAVPLMLQQLYSHGTLLVRSITEPPFDWSSLGVLLFFPGIVAVLTMEARLRVKLEEEARDVEKNPDARRSDVAHPL